MMSLGSTFEVSCPQRGEVGVAAIVKQTPDPVRNLEIVNHRRPTEQRRPLQCYLSAHAVRVIEVLTICQHQSVVKVTLEPQDETLIRTLVAEACPSRLARQERSGAIVVRSAWHMIRRSIDPGRVDTGNWNMRWC
jgi:hypothetical protein